MYHVLVFNCLKERDPGTLLPALAQTLAAHGVLLSQVRCLHMQVCVRVHV